MMTKADRRLTVLLIEDNEDDYDLARNYLSLIDTQTYELHWITCYHEGLRALEAGTYDVSLIDHSLGNHSGIELLEAAAQFENRPPIIILTGCPDREVDLWAMRSGASDYLNKDELTPNLLERSIRYSIERKRAEDRLRAADEQLRRKQKLEAVGSLAAGFAHEFNNLLQAIQGYTQFAIDGLSPTDPRYDDLQQAVKAASRAASLTRQLLNFSRQQPLRKATVDVNEIVEDFLVMLRPFIGRNMQIEVQLGEQVGAVEADVDLFHQVLMNLCINARDAMDGNGRITLATSRVMVGGDDPEFADLAAGDYTCLSVADTGCGMSLETKKRIFDPFFTTKEVGKGTGLGLAMVHGAIQQHEGAIRVESQQGQGATFEVYLPIVNKQLHFQEAGWREHQYSLS